MTVDSVSKIMSLVVISFVTAGAITVFVVDSIMGRPIPDVISTFVYTAMGSALGYSIHSLGTNSGASIVNTTTKQSTGNPG